MTTTAPSNPATEGGQPTLTSAEFDERLFEIVEAFVNDDHFDNFCDDLSMICSDEQWDIVNATLDMIRDELQIELLITHSDKAAQPQAAEVKAKTITAKEFVEQGYKDKISRKECQVFRYDFERDAEIIDIDYSPMDRSVLIGVMVTEDAMWDTIIDDDHKLTVTWFPAPRQPVLATAEGEAADEVIALRVEVAHLRGVLTVIRDYPTVETDMELGHQVAGMAMQAEVALEDDPPRSGLLSILLAKNEALKTDNEYMSAQLAALQRQQQAAGGLVEALKPFARTYNAWLERPNTDVFFADWLKAHLGKNTSAFARHARSWFEQATAALAAYEASAGGSEEVGK